MTYYFASTRGTERIMYAATDCRFNPMLEQFGQGDGKTPIEAYNAWAKSRGVPFKCIKAKKLPHVRGNAWVLDTQIVYSQLGKVKP